MRTGRGTQFVLLLMLTATTLLSCHGGGETDMNPGYDEPVVWGLMSKLTDDDLTVTCDKSFDVFDYDGLRMVPVVTLNDTQVQPLSYSPIEYEYGDTNIIPANHRYDLSVRHYWGIGFCHLVMPGDFVLTLPPRVPFDTFVVTQGSELATAWRASRGAQWYWLSVYVNYDYYDSLGTWDNFEFRLDTLVHDTATVVPPERVFPSTVSQVIEGDGSVTIWSGYGPPIEPGDIGNVRGNAVGFVNAINEPPSRYFPVGAAPARRRAPDGRSELERFKAILRGRLPGQ